MAGKSPVKASDEQRAALEVLAVSRNRGEADRARAILLTLDGWTSARIAEVFLVREDTVRFWRGDFARGGVEALKASVYAGPPPLKTEAALRVCVPLLEAPVANRANWRSRASSPRSKSANSSISGRRNSPRRCEKKLPVAAATAHAEGAANRG